MAMVYLSKGKHNVVKDESPVSQRYATLAAIARRGHEPILSSGLEVDESQLDADGFVALEAGSSSSSGGAES